MRTLLRRATAVSLVAMLCAAPAAEAAVVFKSFSPKRERALRADLAKSLLPFSALLDVVVSPRDLPDGVLGFATTWGEVFLAPDVFASADVRTFALFHELGHQLDYQVLTNAERRRFFRAAGFGSGGEVKGHADKDWYDPASQHHKIPAEQFASAVSLVVWPRKRGNTFLAEDGSCRGWEYGEGCAAPLPQVRALVNAVLARNGLALLGRGGGNRRVAVEETFIPPRLIAPPERLLRIPDAGVPQVPTMLTALAPQGRIARAREGLLRVRLDAGLGAIPGETVLIDYRDRHGWWALGEFETDHVGEVAYTFRPKGWRPNAFRITFVGSANLAGTSLVVPVRYRR